MRRFLYLLLAMTLAVHVPLLWVWGPHYFYWPAAFGALFNAGLWQYGLIRWCDGGLHRGGPQGDGAPGASVVDA